MGWLGWVVLIAASFYMDDKSSETTPNLKTIMILGFFAIDHVLRKIEDVRHNVAMIRNNIENRTDLK